MKAREPKLYVFQKLQEFSQGTSQIGKRGLVVLGWKGLQLPGVLAVDVKD